MIIMEMRYVERVSFLFCADARMLFFFKSALSSSPPPDSGPEVHDIASHLCGDRIVSY